MGCPGTEDEILQTGWRHWGELSLSRTAVPLCHCHVPGCVSLFCLISFEEKEWRKKLIDFKQSNIVISIVGVQHKEYIVSIGNRVLRAISESLE